jgi:dynein heavy chain 1
MPATADTASEVKFWLELDAELHHIDSQLKTPEAETTLTVLKQAKRFIATAPFDSDTIGLRKTLDKVQDFKSLVKEFPIGELLAASDIAKVTEAVVRIFNHMKKSKNSQYPVQRYLRLVEALSRDMCGRLLTLARAQHPIHQSFDEFDRTCADSRLLFSTWEAQFEAFRETVRELAKKRGQQNVPLRVNVEHKSLQDRLADLHRFRKQHEELRSVIVRVLPSTGGAEAHAVKEINAAYEEVRDVDPLNMSKEGTELWLAARGRYDRRIDRVESEITAKLRDRLATAKNAHEMFRVFSKFNALFVRPRVKGAIQEYQTQLIERVKDDIHALQDTFKTQYPGSEAAHLSTLRDLPPVSGAIIWTRQIKRQLATYMQRVEDVLGKTWENDPEGKVLKEEGERFEKKLNTDVLFDRWVKDTESRTFEVTGRLLDVVKKGNKLALDLNFDPNIAVLFKEVRNLQWLGYRVPFTITILSTGARQVYPFAVSLKEAVRSYGQACSKVHDGIAPLLVGHRTEVQNHLNEGFRLKWESVVKLEPYVKRLTEAVSSFQDKVDSLLTKHELITAELDALKTCAFSKAAFSGHLTTVQKIIDEFNLASLTNLESWTAALERQIEVTLTQRLGEAMNGWNALFDDGKPAAAATGPAAANKKPSGDAAPGAPAALPASSLRPVLEKTKHEIVIRNQTMLLVPPLEQARATWISQLSRWAGAVCDLDKLRSNRYDAAVAVRGKEAAAPPPTYKHLLNQLPGDTLVQAYRNIEKKLEDVRAYVHQWLQYQALWDLDATVLYQNLGADLLKWQQLLAEIKDARKTIETSETEKAFGPIVVNYAQVQASVNNKYDFWQKEVLVHFGGKLGEAMNGFYTVLKTARSELEHTSLETDSTADALALIIQVQELKKKVLLWEPQIKSFKTGQQVLQRNRYQFPADWYVVADVPVRVLTSSLQARLRHG